MRSLITFMVCTGFIVWAHSCDKRIVGVKIYGHGPDAPGPAQEGFTTLNSQLPLPLLLAHASGRSYADSVAAIRQDNLLLR
jgi:hypothetical protein